MNEPNSSNMLFGALVARNEASHPHTPTVAAPRASRTTLAWAGAALLSIVIVLVAV